MKFFISSVIGGFEAQRDTAVRAVRALQHEAVRAEDFGASPDSPQVACLAGLRQSEAVILILGERYGEPQASGLSPTHEEYREARDSKYVMAFIQESPSAEAAQVAFINEVQGWQRGHYTASFRTVEELHDKVTRGLHEFLLLHEAAPLDEEDLLRRAAAVLPDSRRISTTLLSVVIAPGPNRAALRPAELEDPQLARTLQAEALTGEHPVLTTTAGTQVSTDGDALLLTQQDADRLVRLDESGRLLLVRRAVENDRGRMGFPSLIEEDVRDTIGVALRFAATALDLIDPVSRLSHVALVAALSGAGYLPWRTRSEQQQNPNVATMGLGGQDQVVVHLTPAVRRRPALTHETTTLAEDLTVRLRREVRR